MKGRKIVRWIFIGLALLVALVAAWLIWFGISKRNEETPPQPPVTQGDSAAPQEQEKTDHSPEQTPNQPEQTGDETQTGATDETVEQGEPGEEESTDEAPSEEESTEEDQPANEPNDLGWG